MFLVVFECIVFHLLLKCPQIVTLNTHLQVTFTRGVCSFVLKADVEIVLN